MSFFDHFVHRQPNLFAKNELVPHKSVDLESAATVLAAADRVAKRFDVATNSSILAAALRTAKTHDTYAAALNEAGIYVIDTATALQYRAKRTKPTFFDRFKSWSRVIYRLFLHGKHGTASALLAASVTVPAAILLTLDSSVHDIDIFKSVLFIWLFLFIAPIPFAPNSKIDIIIASRAELEKLQKRNEEQHKAFFHAYGRLFAGIHGILIGLPVWLLTTLFYGMWFHKGESGRGWKPCAVKDYQKVLPDSVVLSIDQVLQALPKAKIELEILEPSNGDKDEMFVTLPIGDVDRLYLWHEAA